MTESQLEQETLGWLSELGYAVHGGYDIAHDGANPQRSSYRALLMPRLISGQLRLPEVQVPLDNPAFPARSRTNNSEPEHAD